jgi:phage regulator Rha-like protein
MKSLQQDIIQNKIYTVRQLQVMLDSDLAILFETETKFINRSVKRNLKRFPEAFACQLTSEEWEAIRCQNGTLNNVYGRGQHRKYLPWVFTEQGVAMLSAVLNTDHAVTASIQIIHAFVSMRNILMNNAHIIQRIDQLEINRIRTDEKIGQIFDALQTVKPRKKQGVFFDGQIFDAYVFISEIIQDAKNEIVLIDNYIDDSTLTILLKKRAGVKVGILTKSYSRQLLLDIQRVNQQYGGFEVHHFDKSHDRFLIIDRTVVYHIGASLKDLGKKWFAFSKMDNLSVSNIVNSIPK